MYFTVIRHHSIISRIGLVVVTFLLTQVLPLIFAFVIDILKNIIEQLLII